MTDDIRFEDVYRRLNTLTEDVTDLKISAGNIGTLQVAVSRTLSMVTALTSELTEQKADIRQLKADMREVKADLRQVSSDVSEILRILRDRNGGSGL
jgi:peptidoglycan hydrolase CwlO-like protein